MALAADLLITGGTLVPMVADRSWSDGNLLIKSGRIAAMGRGDFTEDSGIRRLDAAGCLVLPGFVQGHVHVVQSLLRHQADGLELLEWLRERTWPYEAALEGDDVEAAAALGAAELIAGGTTTALDMGTTRHQDRVFQGAGPVGIRLISGMAHMDRADGAPTALLVDADTSLAEAEAVGRRWHGAHEGRLRYAVAPRFVLSCTPRLLGGCVELARREGWLLHSHVAENRDEVAAVRAVHGRSDLEVLDDAGMTGGDVVLAHGVHLDEGGISLAARTATRICHCPGANLKLGSGIADLPSLRRAGVPVLVGADGPPCNNRLSVLREMSLAATLHSIQSGPAAVTAWDVLRMATCEGARALGLKDVGTLEVGQWADVVVLDLGGWSMLPAGDPASRVVHGATARDIRHVVVAGRAVVVDGRVVRCDEEAIRDAARASWRRVAARMGADV